MALDIVYGFQGKDHVTAAQLGRLLAGTVGDGRYVLDTQNKLKAEMQTANKVRIGTGDLVMDGRFMTNEAYVELTVESGVSGQKRNDIVGVQYEKASGTGIETPDFAVLKGTATAGTPADPEYEAGNILEGSTTAFMPLWRLPIDGLNVGEPVQLFEEIKSSKGIWDSVSQTESGSIGDIATYRRIGNVAVVYVSTVINAGTTLTPYGQWATWPLPFRVLDVTESFLEIDEYDKQHFVAHAEGSRIDIVWRSGIAETVPYSHGVHGQLVCLCG